MERKRIQRKKEKQKKNKKAAKPKKPVNWGYSSAGRAPALHAGGQEFDPP